MILIADAGGTKTDWVVVQGEEIVERIATQGINPFHQSAADISRLLSSELQPLLHTAVENLTEVYFYGSGCTPEKIPLVKACLAKMMVRAGHMEVASDLLGAARAVCGHEPGMACILGTGSNSCLYDGSHISRHTPPLGYILGDEGSGASIGNMFLNGIYKGLLPRELGELYESFSGCSQADVIRRVYQEPMANRFLASVSQFVAQHLDVPELHEMVVQNFRVFFQKNIRQYQHPELALGVVGGLGVHYQAQLQEAARQEHVVLGAMVKSPVERLVQYHSAR